MLQMLPMTQRSTGIKIVPRMSVRRAWFMCVRNQLHKCTTRCWTDWSSMISGELCDDEACIGTCYDDINEVGDCAIDIECGSGV